MDLAINFLIQLLNSVQYGLLLFMLAAGLTLIFGIMGIVVNLAPQQLYMLGAYMPGLCPRATGSLALAIAVRTVVFRGVWAGLLLERLLFRHFYRRGLLGPGVAHLWPDLCV